MAEKAVTPDKVKHCIRIGDGVYEANKGQIKSRSIWLLYCHCRYAAVYYIWGEGIPLIKAEDLDVPAKALHTAGVILHDS